MAESGAVTCKAIDRGLRGHYFDLMGFPVEIPRLRGSVSQTLTEPIKAMCFQKTK